MKIPVSMVLLLLGLSMFLVSFFNMTRVDVVIDVSFVLKPGETYGPYKNGTYYHTTVISKSTLAGEITVEGNGVNFTANGYNTQSLKNVFINQNYSFIINPADDIYTFTFYNTGSGIQSFIKFTLKEKWTNILLLILGSIGLLILALAGLVLIIRFRKQLSKRSRTMFEA